MEQLQIIPLDYPTLTVYADLVVSKKSVVEFELPTALKAVKVIDHKRAAIRARCLRVECGISQVELARRMKITPGYLSDLEHGRRNWSEKLSARFEAALNGREA